MPEEHQRGRHRAYDCDDGFIQAWQWGDPVLRNVTDLLVAAVRGRKGRAIDVGCGTGRAAVALAQVGLEVDAVDVDPGVIAIAERAAARLGVRVSYRVADLCSARGEFADASYDVVVCMEVLEHVEAWQGALANLRRILKPGGLLFLTVPYDPRQYSVLDEYAGHLRRFRRQEIVPELAGLQLDVCTVGFPSFRAVTWVYDRALRLSRCRHAPEKLHGRGGWRLLLPRAMYALSKVDNLFNRFCWGTTLVICGRRR